MTDLPIDSISLPSRLFYSASENKIYVGTPGDYKEINPYAHGAAIDITFDNTSTDLDAENVQELGDELDDKKLDKVITGSQERVYAVNEINTQTMISTRESFVSDIDIISALQAGVGKKFSISVSGKTMYKGQEYFDDSAEVYYKAYEDDQIFKITL